MTEIRTWDPVLSRRSIRRFTDEPVEEERIKLLLTAAMAAPSAGDERPWHFVVIRDSGTKKRLAEVSPFTQATLGAPCAVLICGDETMQKCAGCWMLDCAAATENVLVEAQYLGLGAVWLGIYPNEGRIQRVRAIIHAPQEVIPFSLIAVGYPNEHREPALRYDDRRVHWNSWGMQHSVIPSKSFYPYS